MRLRALIAALLTLTACAGNEVPQTRRPEPRERILIFSKTVAFRHESIAPAIAALVPRLGQLGLEAETTEDARAFTSENLSSYRAVVFLMTTGDVLDPAHQEAFEGFVLQGGGYAGVHSASDTEYEWPFYGDLVGAYFKTHPQIGKATIKVIDRNHPSTDHLEDIWTRTDEWYNFRSNPRGKVRILLTLDEATYSGGDMGSDHPIAWCHLLGAGRSWYTGGGHTVESYAEESFLEHLVGGIQFAAGTKQADCSPN